MQKLPATLLFLGTLALGSIGFSSGDVNQVTSLEDQEKILRHHKKLCDEAKDPETKKLQCAIYANLLTAYQAQKKVLQGTADTPQK